MKANTLVVKPDGSQVMEDVEVSDNWFDPPKPAPEPEPVTLASTNQRVDELSTASDDIMAALTELAGMVDAMAGGEANG